VSFEKLITEYKSVNPDIASLVRSAHSIWPLILINQNLSPSVRVETENLICCGLIPHGVKDMDSFLRPLIDTFKSWSGVYIEHVNVTSN
jgi:hypothetical protein